MRRIPVAVATVLALACGPTPAAKEPAARQDEAPPFAGVVDETLRRLAAIDRRLALRTGAEPREADLRALSMDVILREDTGAMLEAGALDPFSFAARRRALEAVRDSVARAPARKADASVKEGLLRLVAAEVLREEEERGLPGSASVLVSALAHTWKAPKTAEEIADRDRWLARRIGEIDAAVEGTPLLEPARTELDDALDAIENLIKNDPYQKTTHTLTRLRGRLESMHVRGEPAAWAPVAHALEVHVGGSVPAPNVLDRRFADAEALLDQAVKARRASTSDATLRRIDEEAARLLFVEAECRYPGGGSAVSRMGAPPERTPVCHLIVRLAAAMTPDDELVVLTALRDHVAVARWALDVAAGPQRSPHPFVSSVSMQQGARLMRLAGARPAVAIGAGLMAEILGRAGSDPARVKDAAVAWTRAGETPLDLLFPDGAAISRAERPAISR